MITCTLEAVQAAGKRWNWLIFRFFENRHNWKKRTLKCFQWTRNRFVDLRIYSVPPPPGQSGAKLKNTYGLPPLSFSGVFFRRMNPNGYAILLINLVNFRLNYGISKKIALQIKAQVQLCRLPAACKSSKIQSIMSLYDVQSVMNQLWNFQWNT